MRKLFLLLIFSLQAVYTESDSKIGRWQGGAPNLSQAKPAPKQLNLKSLAMQAGLKFGGCPTQPEPIFESRAVYGAPLAEQFERMGYVEICDEKHAAFDSLYAHFDAFTEFLQVNPIWAQKLYGVKERFIRSKERAYYSTDFFGQYDESKTEKRCQISFYYSTHFHDFISARYPEFTRVLEIRQFFDACREIQKPCKSLFENIAEELGLNVTFPILLKVVKYLPGYTATRPHYDGSAFSLFLDSTDDQSLLLAPYKPSYTVDDFSSPLRKTNSTLLIPGTHLTDFSIYPTPHIALQTNKTRYATVVFAMRSNYTPQKVQHPPLPNFDH